MGICPCCAHHALPTLQGIFSPELGGGESQVQAGLESLLRAQLLLKSHRSPGFFQVKPAENLPKSAYGVTSVIGTFREQVSRKHHESPCTFG